MKNVKLNYFNLNCFLFLILVGRLLVILIGFMNFLYPFVDIIRISTSVCVYKNVNIPMSVPVLTKLNSYFIFELS